MRSNGSSETRELFLPGTIENCNSNSSEGVLESSDHLTFLAFEFKTLLSCSSVTHNAQFQSKIYWLQQTCIQIFLKKTDSSQSLCCWFKGNLAAFFGLFKTTLTAWFGMDPARDRAGQPRAGGCIDLTIL